MARLSDTGWHVLQGGLRRTGTDRAQALWLRPVPPTGELKRAHFIGLRDSVIATAQAHLRAMLARPAGSPAGGPMHVDGACSWLRRLKPAIVTDICEPGLAFQRPSRSDIAEAVGLRALPVVSQMLSPLRTTHNSLVH